MPLRISAPLIKEEIDKLKAGDSVLISGYIYTARDAAHKKMTEGIKKGEPLPFEPEGQVIYYAGPAPAKPGAVIGSCGPTTSGRMDAYTPAMLDRGIKGMIGKGERSREVRESIVKNGCIYFAAVGGAGALISKTVEEACEIAYPELGTEAVRRLKVKDFPAVVIIDKEGNDLYEQAYGQKSE